jgi:putative ABC transport system substrate-binding protein
VKEWSDGVVELWSVGDRQFVVIKKILCLALCALLLALSLPAEAQQPKKVPQIGYLSTSDPASESTRSEPIRRSLRELGYTEGQNIAIEY